MSLGCIRGTFKVVLYLKILFVDDKNTTRQKILFLLQINYVSASAVSDFIVLRTNWNNKGQLFKIRNAAFANDKIT